jgi:Fic-DOC domain mobile mystery protein B
MEIKLIHVPWSTPLDPDELDGLIPWHISTQWDLNEWESLNIENGISWSKSARGNIFTEEFCKKLHKKMFAETWQWAWEFRKSDKNIWCPWIQVGVELRDVLDTAQFWFEHKTFPLHEIAIRLHYRLVFVHPFPNGNGRFSRAMADILLQRNKQTPLLWHTFGDLENTSHVREMYIASLRKADNWDFDDVIQLCSPK